MAAPIKNVKPANPPDTPPDGPRKRKRWPMVLALLTIGGGALAWFLPWLVANTPLLPWGLRAATGKIRGTATLQQASLGWLSPVSVGGLEVRDEKNQVVLQAARASSQKSLAALLFSGAGLGTFRVEQPKLTIVLRRGGSNIEDALAKVLAAPPSREPSARRSFDLEIVDASVTIVDQESGQRWQVQNARLTTSLPQELGKPVRIEAEAVLADLQHPGRLSLKLLGEPGDSRSPSQAAQPHGNSSLVALLGTTKGSVDLSATEIPLEMFRHILARFGPQAALAGRLGIEVHGQWGKPGVAGAVAEGLTFQAEATAQDFRSVWPSGEKFQEAQMHVGVRGAYSPAADVLRLEQVALDSDVVALQAGGQVTLGPGEPAAELAGQIDYDWDRIGDLLRPYLGPSTQIHGRGICPLTYRGPLSLAQGTASADLKWDSAVVDGLAVGGGELKAVLANGLVTAAPVQVVVNRMPLLLAPQLRLTPQVELLLPAGPVAQHVFFDAATCHAALKYILPLLADVTTAQGSASLTLDGARIPLADPAKGEVAGRLTIHAAEVGTGPLLSDLTALFNGGATAKLARESVVAFRMVNGRIYHENMQLEFPHLTIRTYGSVGLDQSLALMTETTLPAKWLGAAASEPIRLPINGTLARPQVDRQAAQQASRQLLGTTARNVLQNEVNRGLQRLLPPR